MICPLHSKHVFSHHWITIQDTPSSTAELADQGGACSQLFSLGSRQSQLPGLVNIQKKYGKSHLLMGKSTISMAISTISMAIFNSYVSLPEGKHTKKYGKSHLLMGKSTISMAISTISMAIFNSYVSLPEGKHSLHIP